jgi:hypothetical protein
MKNYNQLELVLFSKYSFKNLHQKDLVRWLGTTAQNAISHQQGKTKKLFLKVLKDSTAIYLS